MPSTLFLEAEIRLAFQAQVVLGVITPHECEECLAIRVQLQSTPWSELPAEFVEANAGSLPLLSQEAYVAYIAAWLLQAIREPSEEVASMLLTNLSFEPQTTGFSLMQRKVIIKVAEHVVAESYWGPNDPSNIESLAAIHSAWQAPAA
jgi:hypothetical protein